MHMMHQTKYRFFDIQRSKKRNPILTVDNHIEPTPEFGKIINKGPDINQIKSAPAHYFYAVNNFPVPGLSVVAAKNCNLIALQNPLLGQLLDINLSAPGIGMLPVPPVKN